PSRPGKRIVMPKGIGRWICDACGWAAEIYRRPKPRVRYSCRNCLHKHGDTRINNLRFSMRLDYFTQPHSTRKRNLSGFCTKRGAKLVSSNVSGVAAALPAAIKGKKPLAVRGARKAAPTSPPPPSRRLTPTATTGLQRKAEALTK